MEAMARRRFSGALKPASALPFQASSTESPREKASSPRPACSRLRFSTEALVACTEVLAPSMPLPYSCDRATPIGQYTPLVPPVSTLMKVGAARAALLAVKATAAANRPRRLLMRMDTTPFLLGVFRSDRRPPNNLAGAVPLPKNRAPGPLPGARQGRRGAAIGKKPLIAVMQSARIRL